MSRTILAHLIESALFLGGMDLTRGWFERSRQKSEIPAASGRAVLVHPPFLLGLAVVFTAMGAAGAFFSYGSPTGGPLVASFFAGLALVGLYLCADCVRVRHTLEPDGLQFRLLVREGRMRWFDVRGVRYLPVQKMFRLETSEGSTLKVSVALTSLPAFTHALLDGVAPGNIDPSTRVVLEQTAGGSPPSIWG